jgi:hypothetical protein
MSEPVTWLDMVTFVVVYWLTVPYAEAILDGLLGTAQ